MRILYHNRARSKDGQYLYIESDAGCVLALFGKLRDRHA